MSIEVEIQQARDRKPIPVWEGLARIDGIAHNLAQGYSYDYAVNYQEVAQPVTKAEARPPFDAAAGDYSYMDQLEARAKAWDNITIPLYVPPKVTNLPLAQVNPDEMKGLPRPKTYVGLTPAQIAKEKFEQVKRELAAKIAARREQANA